MNARTVSLAVALALTGCVSVPPAPPAEVVRLQNELDRLHRDPRVVDNGGVELSNADIAVNSLARDYRVLDVTEREQRVYVADRLVQIAEASGRARAAEQHSRDLGAERERLLARAGTRDVVAPPQIVERRVMESSEWLPPERRTLMAIQSRLPNMESQLDARGLVVRFSEYQFQPGRSEPTPTAERSLDQLARVLREEPATHVAVEGIGGDGDRALALDRADAVRDYLDARGVEPARVTVRSADPSSVRDRRVDVVILAAR
ncbi:OmpA family protein [Dokdonella sp.]|uniref:OmpA family protein n=1 Tax=Dokdonella sp. TaxID=2291710 RepID=UPI001B0F0538|nr:OmpA family protein [Dokdonella sp.]MBO9661452.1 OmpA family protein [Dokdonella sp.]